MDKSGGIRTQLSFLVSVVLHGGVFAFLALGPLFLTSKTTDTERTTVSFTTTETPSEAPQHVEAAAAPAPAPAVIEAPKPEVKTVAVAPAPAPAPAKAKAPRVRIAKAKRSAPRAVVAPQDVLPAENTETPLEKAADSTDVKTGDVVVAKNEEKIDQQQGEPAPVEKTVTESATSETAKEETDKEDPAIAAAAAQDEDVAPKAADTEFAGEKPQATPATAPVVEDAPKAVAPPLPAPVINKAAAPAPAPAGGSAANLAAASSSSGVNVTQSYTGLKQMAGNKPPAYTRDMRMAQMQGAGQLVYFVNKDGSVNQVQLTKSTGYADLDQAAIDAFSKYKFVPGQEGFTVHNFEFSLKGPAISDVGRLRTTMK